MKSRSFLVLAVGLVVIAAETPRSSRLHAQAAPPSTDFARAVLDQYCVTCHNQRVKTAGLMLDQAALADVPANAEIWEKVIRKVRGGVMPPPGAPHPDQAARERLISSLQTPLDQAALA